MASGLPSSVTVKEKMDRETVRFTLEWTLEKFKTLRKKLRCCKSVGISMRELGQDEFDGRWRIGVNPCTSSKTKTEEGVEKSYMGVCLILTDVETHSYTSNKSVDAEFVIRVCTGNGAELTRSSGQKEHTFSAKEYATGCLGMVSHDKLFGIGETPGLLKDDCLTIIIDVLMYGEPKAVSTPGIVTADTPKRYKGFARRQAESLASNPHLPPTDFEIRSNDGQVFPTYRLLLMSHSPVFAAMLSHNSKENQQSRCDLEDIDGETVGVMLDYIYGCDTGKVTVSNAEKILIMADKYEMMDLLAVCDSVLVQSVTGENAVHYLVLASQRKLDKLKDAAMKVIPKHMGTVLKNGALLEVLQSDPELMQTIVENCSKKGAQ